MEWLDTDGRILAAPQLSPQRVIENCSNGLQQSIGAELPVFLSDAGVQQPQMLTADGAQRPAFQRCRIFVGLPARVLYRVVRVFRLGLEVFLDVLLQRSAESQFVAPFER